MEKCMLVLRGKQRGVTAMTASGQVHTRYMTVAAALLLFGCNGDVKQSQQTHLANSELIMTYEKDQLGTV
jgi:hypothetical protein